MKLPRDELEKALQLAQPALFAKDTVEELGCFWFDGKTVRAYDGELGISVPLKTNVEGGIKGQFLLQVVKAAKADEVEFVSGANEALTLKAGKSKTTFSVLPLSRRPKWPDSLEVSKPIQLSSDFIECLRLSGKAVGKNLTRPDYLGTTIIRTELEGESALDLFSSDGATATWLLCAPPERWDKDRLAWPRRFCDQVAKSCDDDSLIHLTKSNALAVTTEGVRILGRELLIEQPVQFSQMMDRVLPKGFSKMLYAIPDELKEALKQATVVLPKATEGRITIDCDGKGKLVIRSEDLPKSKSVETVITIDKTQGELSINASPSFILRALDNANRMLLTEQVLIVEHDNTGFLHIISVSKNIKVKATYDEDVPF